MNNGTDANPATPGGREELDREYVLEVFGKAYRKLEQSPEPSKGELITIDAAIEAYTDITLMPLVAQAKLAGARLLAEKVKEHVTYAQWVLEREKPVNYDKEVVRVEKIDAALKEMEANQ